MADYSWERRVAALEVQLGGKTLQQHFKEHAELLDERLAYQFGELEKKLDSRFARIDARFEQHDHAMARIDQRFERIDARFNEIEARFVSLEAKFDAKLDAKRVSGISCVGIA